MFRLFILVLCFASATLTAQKFQLENGSSYEVTQANAEGRVAVHGEYVRFHASLISQTDSLLFSTKSDKGEPQLIRLDTAAARQTEIVQVLRKIRDGETAMIQMSLDQFGVKPPGLENDSIVFYELELLEIVSEEAFAAEQQVKEAKANAARKLVQAREQEALAFHADILAQYRAGTLTDLQETASGLKYLIHEEGTGTVPVKGDPISVNYIGSLAEGDKPPFDQSFRRGEPIRFPVGIGRVIDGWDEGLLLLPAGTKATFFIPAALGYAERGAGADIPPNAELVFYVEVE